MNHRKTVYIYASVAGVLMLCSASYGQATMDIYGRHDITVREKRDSSQDWIELNNQVLQFSQQAEQQRLERERMRMQQNIEQQRLRQQQEYQQQLLQLERQKLELQQKQQEQQAGEKSRR